MSVPILLSPTSSPAFAAPDRSPPLFSHGRQQKDILITALLGAPVTAIEPVNINATAPTCQTLETIGKPQARHEATCVGPGAQRNLLGGLRSQLVDVDDPATKTRTGRKAPPVAPPMSSPSLGRGQSGSPAR